MTAIDLAMQIYARKLIDSRCPDSVLLEHMKVKGFRCICVEETPIGGDITNTREQCERCWNQEVTE